MADLYDKVQLRGVESLTDQELLMLLIDEGSEVSRTSARELLQQAAGSLKSLSRCELARLRMVAGIGLKRAVRLKVAMELGRRVMALEAEDVAEVLLSSDDVVKLFRPLMGDLKHEECWVAYLTASNRLIERHKLSQGGVVGTVVDHRLVVKRALELLSPQIILLHNHPSGTAEPSEADRHLTERIAQAAALFDIRLVDHLILTADNFYSFRAHGLLTH